MHKLYLGKKIKDSILYLTGTGTVMGSDWMHPGLSQPGDFSERTGMSGGKINEAYPQLNKLQAFSQVAVLDSGL